MAEFVSNIEGELTESSALVLIGRMVRQVGGSIPEGGLALYSDLDGNLGLASRQRLELLKELSQIFPDVPSGDGLFAAETVGEVVKALIGRDGQYAGSGEPLPFRDPPPTLFTALLTLWSYFVLAVLFAAAVVTAVILVSERLSRKCARFYSSLLCTLSTIPIKRAVAENIPEQAIFVANHASYMDIPIVCSTLPNDICFVAKRELSTNPLLRFFFSRLGTQFVERYDARQARRDLDKMVQPLKSGDSLVFFAEGTFLGPPGILPFRAGAFVLAERFNLPIVPISLKGTREAFRGDQWWIRRHPVTITVHKALPRVTPENRQEIRDECRRIIAEAAGEPMV